MKLKTTGLTGTQWLARLDKGGYKVSSFAKEIILSKEFDKLNLKKGVSQEIAIVKHSDVGVNPTTQEIREYAKAKGYDMPTPEFALLVREQLSDEDIEKLGVWYVLTLHDPIKDSDGGPCVLYAGRDDGGRWVYAGWDNPGRRWNTVGASAFPVSASGTQKSDTKLSLNPESLTLELAIKMVKEAGYQVAKII